VTKELCIECEEPTGRAGRADDSILANDGTGPFCEACFHGGLVIENRNKRIAELERENGRLKKNGDALHKAASQLLDLDEDDWLGIHVRAWAEARNGEGETDGRTD